MMNPIGAVAVVSSLVAFSFSYRLLFKRAMVLRFIVLSMCLALSTPALLVTLYYFHVIPEMVWFYSMRSWTGSEFLVLFIGTSGGAAAAMLPRWLMLLPLLGSTGLAIVPYLKPVMNPLDLSSSSEKWDGDTCLQSTESTCGPACTANILRSFGINASEHEIARAAFTSGSGTEAWYLARYVRGLGLDARFEFEKTFSTAVGFPAMIGVRVGSFGHFIAVLDANETQVTYVDPLSGKFSVPTDEFLRRYGFTGFHMVVSKE